MALTDTDREAISHALSDDDAKRPWTCVCAGCVEYRKDCSPNLMEVHVAFARLERAEARYKEWREVRRPLLERVLEALG